MMGGGREEKAISPLFQVDVANTERFLTTKALKRFS